MLLAWNLYIFKNVINFFEIPISLKYNYLFQIFNKNIKIKSSYSKNILFYKFLIIFELLCQENNYTYFNRHIFMNKDETIFPFVIEGVTDFILIKNINYLSSNSIFYSIYKKYFETTFLKKYSSIEKCLDISIKGIEEKFDNYLLKYNNTDDFVVIKYSKENIPKEVILSIWTIRLGSILSASFVYYIKSFLDLFILALYILLLVLTLRLMLLKNISFIEFRLNTLVTLFFLIIFSLSSLVLFIFIKKRVSTPLKYEKTIRSKYYN